MGDHYQASGNVNFLTVQEPADYANQVLGKITAYRKWLTGNGLDTLWKKKLNNYYGISENGNRSQAVTAGGSEGELSMIKVNDLHNLIQSQLVIVTGERPAGIAKPSNSDTASLKASMYGSAVAEYYMHEHDFEIKFKNAAEIALLCDEAYVEQYWNKSTGADVLLNEDNSSALKSGDGCIAVRCPWNVARDPSANVDQQKWHIITFKINKWDAAAEHPEFADQILAAREENLPQLGLDKIADGSDMIYAHKVIADRTPSVPDGRYSLIIGSTTVEDGPLPFDYYPLDRITPSDVIEGSVGYSASNDILGLEDITDALYSSITTNQITFATQNIVAPSGANLNVSDLGKGVRVFELDPNFIDKLRPLNLTSTPPEVFQYIQMLTAKKDNMVGANSVTKGQPQGQLAGASGAALALIQAQAISFNSGIQQSYFKLVSSVMTKFIRLLQQNMSEPKLIKIVGKTQSYGIREFKITGQDLSGISAITYSAVDPISQTVGGRLALADSLLSKPGMIQSPKQYLTVAKTGDLDPMTQDSEIIQMTILEENENLKEGISVTAVITENHADHIRYHNSLLTPDVKQDEEMSASIVAHIQQHIDLWTQASINNPAILLATNQQVLVPGMGLPLPPAPLGPPPGGGPAGPSQPNPTASGPQQGPPPSHPGQPQEPEIKKSLPGFPDIAGTNQKPVIPGVTQ